MIESRYWRAELRDDLRWLRTKQKVKRWSEKQMVLFERRLMLVAFQVRSLLERHKVTDGAAAATVEGVKYPKKGGRPFTLLGAGWLDDRYDLDSPTPMRLSALDVCNQIIHYYVMFAQTNGQGRFDKIVVFSDYKRHTCVYEFDVDRLLDLFGLFADDSTQRTGGLSVWNEKKQDFVWLPEAEARILRRAEREEAG